MIRSKIQKNRLEYYAIYYVMERGGRVPCASEAFQHLEASIICQISTVESAVLVEKLQQMLQELTKV